MSLPGADGERGLTQQGIAEVIVCGIRTEQCCETTARVAFDLGYQVTFVTEATAISTIAHRDAPAGQTLDGLPGRAGASADGGASTAAAIRLRSILPAA